jgi:hypothetical protein
MATFYRDQLELLALGSEVLNRKKREIDLVVDLVGKFLAYRGREEFFISDHEYWRFIPSGARGGCVCDLRLMNALDDGLRTAYSNNGVGLVMAKVGAVHDLLPTLIQKVLDKHPEFALEIAPLLEAGKEAQK